MEKKLPQGRDCWVFLYALSIPLLFPIFKCLSKNAHEPKHCSSITVWWSSSLIQNTSRRTGRLLAGADGRGGVSCYTEKNGPCSIWEAVRPNTCGPHWNTMKLSKWVVFCRLSGCGDGGGGVLGVVGGWNSSAASHCSTPNDTSDIFIDSNKGQTTKAESKIEENTSRKTADLVRHGESAFQWQRLNAQNNATPSRPGIADSPLSALPARLPSFRSLPGTFLPQQSKRYPGRREYLEKYLLWQSCRQLRSWSYNFNPRGQT